MNGPVLYNIEDCCLYIDDLLYVDNIHVRFSDTVYQIHVCPQCFSIWITSETSSVKLETKPWPMIMIELVKSCITNFLQEHFANANQ